MYKILIKNRELEEAESPAYEKYSIYCEDDKEFETDDLNSALNKMNELLDKFLRIDLSLISKIEVNSELTTNLLKIVDINSNMISIINDGKTLSFKIDLSSLDEYTIVNVNNEIFNEVKTYLESLGFTNVRLTDTFEIVADNNTNNKIEGTVTVKKGLFTLYSRKTGTSNYIISEFSTTLDGKQSSDDNNDDDTTETKFVDIYFVDEDNNPLVVDKTELFLRSSLGKQLEIDKSKFDYEFKNVSEVHIEVNNSGNYLIEVEKYGYNSESYYEKVFTGKTKDEDALTIKLTKNVINDMLDSINGENI